MDQLFNQKYIVGINAYNIRAGGGITHLSEILKCLEFEYHNIKQVVLWAPIFTLSKIEDKPWLKKINSENDNNSFISRYKWLFLKSKSDFKKNCVDILLVPGGTYLGSFRPFVTINQNLLPFEAKEISRYGFSLNFFKFYILRLLQSLTNKRADGIIFLTKYAKEKVLKVCKLENKKSIIIPHGVNPKFKFNPNERIYRNVDNFTTLHPCKILYISSIEVYKHQLNVIEAVEKLHNEGLHVKLTLIGPPGSGTRNFLKKMQKTNPQIIEYKGFASYETIEKLYLEAEIGIFASSCETFGMILTESLFCSLPLAASNMSAIPDVLSDSGLYFHPEKIDEISHVLKRMYNSPELRRKISTKGFAYVQKFDWKISAFETFSFMQEIYYNNKKRINAE
jgi:glycosyltransferase involved in cell wall biosynthesis